MAGSHVQIKKEDRTMKKLLALLCALMLVATAVPFAFAEEEPITITYYREELNRNAVATYAETADFHPLVAAQHIGHVVVEAHVVAP